LESPRPPVVCVSGQGDGFINRLVPPPAADHETCSVLVSGTHGLPLPLPEGKERGWKSHHVFRGATPILDFLGCHASILSAGKSPHPPHAHAEEELLIVLDGESDLIISDSAELEGARVERVREGDFVYYAPYQHHTIRNPRDAPVTYLMFKWRGVLSGARQPLGAKLFHYDLIPGEEKPRWSQHLFKIATPYLGELASHVTVLQAGEGYDAHIDPNDVAILLLAGTVETLGRTVTAPSVICYQAGEPHGITNVGRRAGPLSCVRVSRRSSRNDAAARRFRACRDRLAKSSCVTHGDEWRFPFAAC
jgi:oxalate decarboxylase/phosphoglucose isomerase-like protein (cupin superfamily)